MKQIKKNKICYYCLGCNKLEDEKFNGVMHCKGFIAGMDYSEYYKILKGGDKNVM